MKSLLCLAALAATPVHALTVVVQAPDDVRPLLEQHLESARAARLGEQFDDSEIARLQRQSEQTAHDLLATEGFFSPVIESAAEWVDGEWRMTYAVTPGPRTMVRTLTVKLEGAAGEGSAALRGRVERSVSLQPGMPFRQADWAAARLAVLRPLLASRYPAARLAASEARIDPLAQSAELTLTVDSGPAFFYGTSTVKGAERYPASVALHLNLARPGQPYRQQDLLDTQAALETSGYYAQARVRVDPDPSRAAAVPVEIEVIERPAKMFSVGAGISTDTGARVQAGWVHRSVDGEGLRLKLDARVETKKQTGAADLAWPRDAKGYEHSLGAQLKHEDIEGQETHAWLVAARRTRFDGPIEATLSLQYQAETQEVGNVVSARNEALIANYAWTQRAVGRAFYPRRGHVLTLQGGGALDWLLSDTSFVRLYARHTQYLRAGEHGRLVLRGEWGSVLADTRDGIPTDFLFRAGGNDSVRGYAYQSLGRTLTGGVASVRHLATASAEYNYFFGGNWGMAVFVDAGDAADTLGALSPVFGVGVGARYRSPVGPINLDLAYGEAVDDFRLHFSLGVSF